MRTIEQHTLNSFLQDSALPYQVTGKFPASGQRDVYLAMDYQNNEKVILKVAHYNKYSIGRVQREIKILKQIDSSFFPKNVLDTFIAGTILEQYIDNLFTAAKSFGDDELDLKKDYLAIVEQYRANPIRPFYLTVEEFVENISWNDFIINSNSYEKYIFIRECFVALDLLWQNKIAHRDLKPDNILIRPSFKPVVIDLGIAKSFNEGTLDLTPDFIKNPHTIRFASLEQLMDRKDDINYKSDQYSMGLIIYYLHCGKFPFGNIEDIGPNELIRNMIDFNYISIEESGGQCCQELEEFLKKMIMPEPHQRFRTTKKIFQYLDEIQGALE